MSDQCRWERDEEIGRFFLPGCMGGAVYGPERCTCPKPVRAKKVALALEERVERLEALVDQLLRSPETPQKRRQRA